MTTTDEILTTLPILSQDELATVQQRCEALLSHVSLGENHEEDWLLASILEEIKSRGASATIPNYFKIKKPASYAGYSRKSEDIRKFLTRALPARPKKVQLYALGRLCAQALADYLLLTQPYRELSLDQILRQVDQLPLALEASYPGYWASGFLHLLLKPETGWEE